MLNNKFNKKIIKFGSPNDLKTFPNIKDFVIYLNGNTILQKKDSLISYLKEFALIDTMSYLYLNKKTESMEEYGKNKKMIISKLIDIDWFDKNYKQRLEFVKNNTDVIFNESISFQKKFISEITNIDENDIDLGAIFNYNTKNLLLNMTPYFYLQTEDNFDEILNINLNFINKNKTLEQIDKSNEFLATICLEKTFFLKNNKDKLSKIITEYNLKNNKYYSIWIDNFSFWDQSPYKYFDNIYQLIKTIGEEILILHGDIFFKVLTSPLLNTKLTRIVTNNGYGETRSVFGEGGRTYSYFYLYSAHRRINFTQFDKILNIKNIVKEDFIIMSEYEAKICSCVFCKDLFKDVKFSDFITLMTSKKSLMTKKQQIKHNWNSELIIKHFQFSKDKEDIEISDFNEEKILNFLNNWKEEIQLFNDHSLNKGSKNNLHLFEFIEKIKKIIKSDQN